MGIVIRIPVRIQLAAIQNAARGEILATNRRALSHWYFDTSHLSNSTAMEEEGKQHQSR
jgi:hypothetical protein